MDDARRPVWRKTLGAAGNGRPPRDWLLDRGSLTARLQARGRFAVRLLRQQLARPTPDEAAALGLDRELLVWVREVALECDDAPVVFAHTILARTPRGPLIRWFRRLGSRSLGALLFAQVGFSRGTIRCKRIDRRHPLFRPAVHAMRLDHRPPPVLWARRSYFSLGAQSVLVTEVFSPTLYSGQSPGRQKEIA